MDFDVFFKDTNGFDFIEEFNNINTYYNSSKNISFRDIVNQSYGEYPYKEGSLNIDLKIKRIMGILKENPLNGYLYLCQEILNVISFFSNKTYYGFGYTSRLNSVEKIYIQSLTDKINYDLSSLGFKSVIINKKINIVSINVASHEILKINIDNSIKQKILEFNVFNASIEDKRLVIVDLSDYFIANNYRERLKKGPEMYKSLENNIFRLATYFRKPEQTRDDPDKVFIQLNESYWINKAYDLFLFALLHIETLNTLDEINSKINGSKGDNDENIC